MNKFPEENQLEIIEVPPELRGLSDEEIIKRSERELRPVSGKRKNGARRPSKRERQAMKQEKARKEIEKQAKELFYESPISINRANISTNFIAAGSGSYFDKLLNNGDAPKRVLKVAYGAKNEEKSKKITLSLAELAKRRVEERAKKIREALMNKKLSDNTENLPLASEQAAKRPRGRPKKQPENP